MTLPTNQPCILIVDDIDEDIEILKMILKADFRLLVAKTAQECLEMALEQHPDLILLDIVLPDKTGFVVLEELKASCETAEIPVIIITGTDRAQYEEKGFKLGAVDYITKPFHHTVVMARIGAHMKMLHYLRTTEKIAWTDAATGVPNRHRFEKQLAVEWVRAQREQTSLGLLLVSLDCFGDYKASHGTRMGDVMLQKAVEVMYRSLERPENSVFRYDKDRFVVLLPDTDRATAAAVAETVRTGIEAIRVHIRDTTLPPVTVGIGVAATTPGPDDVPDGLFIEAEQSLP